MKFTKILLSFLLIFIFFVLTSCGKSQEEQHLSMHLKDPSSMRVYSSEKRKSDDYDVWCIVYDAKNSYGAYTGRSTAYVYYNKTKGEWGCSNCPYDMGLALTIWESAK